MVLFSDLLAEYATTGVRGSLAAVITTVLNDGVGIA
jgi:hypothetical protein